MSPRKPQVIVCHCKAISDRTIRSVIRHGAESTREIARACGAGRVCGGCRPAVRDVLRSELERRDACAAPPCTHAADEHPAQGRDPTRIAAG
jgi:bacterioferritin-associated ferredoxin